MNKKEIIKKIKLLNPFLSIEERDAESWFNYCEEQLMLKYKSYIEAKQRVAKIKQKLNSLKQ